MRLHNVSRILYREDWTPCINAVVPHPPLRTPPFFLPSRSSMPSPWRWSTWVPAAGAASRLNLESTWGPGHWCRLSAKLGVQGQVLFNRCPHGWKRWVLLRLPQGHWRGREQEMEVKVEVGRWRRVKGKRPVTKPRRKHDA